MANENNNPPIVHDVQPAPVTPAIVIVNGNGAHRPDPIPMDRIRKKVISFHEKMNFVATLMEKYKDEIPPEMMIKRDDLKLEFYIDRRAMARLMRISMMPGFNYMGVFFGLQDVNGVPLEDSKDPKQFGQCTGIFVGLDKERKVLRCHFRDLPTVSEDDERVDGEDTWPPPPPPPGGPGMQVNGATGNPKYYWSLASYIGEIKDYFTMPPTKPTE